MAEPAPPVHRHSDGKLADKASARELGRRGGEAKARRVRLMDALGLSSLVGDTSFGPYRAAAEEFTKHHLGALAAQAGGEVGPAPSTMVASAALQLAASRWAFDEAAKASDPALFKLGSSLANDSRQNLLAAYEIATREAHARPRESSVERYRRDLAEGYDGRYDAPKAPAPTPDAPAPPCMLEPAPGADTTGAAADVAASALLGVAP